jgi:hypothetical protein
MLTLLACRLLDLPEGPLSLIARAAGRPCRRVSKQLHTAYWMLDCSLCLDGTDALEQVLATASRSHNRYHHVRSLEVRLPRSAATNPAAVATHSRFIAALPQTFPSLASLRLPTRSQLDLALLGPLHSSLTSLTIPAGPDLPAVLRNIHPLTKLLSLAITGGLPEGNPGLVMFEITQLPQKLQRLHLFDACLPLRLSASAHFPSLGHRSALTHLSCGLLLVDWDKNALETFSSGLPNLQSLALSMGGAGNEASRIPMDEILAAISSRTLLTALELNLAHLSSACTFHALAPPRLACFTACLGAFCDAASLLEALSRQQASSVGQQQLTQLRLTGGVGACERQLAREGLVHLTSLAGSLQHLELGLLVHSSADLVEYVGKLTRLTTLSLSRVTVACGHVWSRSLCKSGVKDLTNLQSVVVLKLEDDASGFGRAVVSVLPRLAGLRELELRGAASCVVSGWPAQKAQHVDDFELQQALLQLPNLTRLALLRLPGIVGPAYYALRHMPGLRQLQLRGMRTNGLLKNLLPLPPSLRSIRVFHTSEADVELFTRQNQDVIADVSEAARNQDCTLTIEQWRPRTAL